MNDSKNKTIMVVEDEKLTMLFILESLREEGYSSILDYASGEDILAQIKLGLKVDLILMDINIRGRKDGLQTAKEILDIYLVPIVFISAYNDKETIKEVLSISIYGFISKPFNERELSIACTLALENFKKDKKYKEVKKDNTYVKLFEGCFYHLKEKKIFKDNILLELGVNQHLLLDILIKNIDKPVSQEQLSFEIWSNYNESDSSLRTLVYLLKKNLKGIKLSSRSKIGYLLQSSF
jgi:DNA-binding response OmpR family regulator